MLIFIFLYERKNENHNRSFFRDLYSSTPPPLSNHELYINKYKLFRYILLKIYYIRFEKFQPPYNDCYSR